MQRNDQDSFGPDYFVNRQGNDRLRQLSFRQERDYLIKQLGIHVFETGNLLDVGCSTGEFVAALGWNLDHTYGVEVSDYARSLAERKGIQFSRDLSNSANYFDVIIYRGTIQYLPEPFTSINHAFSALKRNGHIVFLATPNSNSIYYRTFGTLPFLEEHLNYLIPSDIGLVMNLRNAGFDNIIVNYPYLATPYARPLKDHFKFVRKRLFGTRDKFPFWKSSMNVIARKP